MKFRIDLKSVARYAALIAWIALTVVAVTSCGKSALTTPAPTPSQQNTVRVDATRVIDALTTALTVIDQAGATASALSLPAATKNDIDCGIAKAVGLDTPSPAVITTCGLVPTRAGAPLRQAKQGLQQATTRPSLQTTIQVILDAARPLWERLEKSGNQVLASLGAILRIALQPAVALGGVK